MTVISESLELYITASHECPYLDGNKATNLLVDPGFRMDSAIYGRLIDKGFRRSGGDVYRPCCYRCQSCVATRVAVNGFKPRRSQRRNWKQNSDLRVVVNEDGFKPEYTELYLSYIRSRHAGGGMDEETPDSFSNFILTPWCDTLLLEFHDQDKLLGVAATDCVPQGLSSVYTFFDPDISTQRGLGIFALLWQIEYAKSLDLEYVYPGYWIAESDKMRYKTDFQPIEGYVDNQWVALPR